MKNFVMNIKFYTILCFSLFVSFIFIDNFQMMDNKFNLILSFAFGLVFAVVFALTIKNISLLDVEIDKERKEVGDLESFVSHMMRHSDLSDFVRDVVDAHLKNRKSIASYQGFFFRIVCENRKLYELFLDEIRRAIEKEDVEYGEGAKTDSNIHLHAINFYCLNEFLQKFIETRGEIDSSKFAPSVVSGTEPSGPVSFKGISN